ncbi:hypothetical protein RQP50_00080 [Paenibacillus sp. chi10]|uniref:Uncharacterized protein n=1 Tax=Paenibacillus suaedae TaxID=3077233 RepID=A0AAJ2JUS4_9BACL|nr:hypothetical protein [Paenibacillus sp. chi10]MDT8974632.1 hypothetical protein [Paenibacillus sp. chi10]
MKDIVQFIFTEIETVKESYVKGVYSKEFALGYLSSLNSLAAKYSLGNLKEDILDNAFHLCNTPNARENIKQIPYYSNIEKKNKLN